MPLFELIEVILIEICLMCIWVVFSLYTSFYPIFSSFINPQMPLRRDNRFAFPPKLTQLIQQQDALMQLLVQNQNQGNNNNNPPPPPPVDHLTRFLRLNLLVFSSSTEPIVANDWLRGIVRELTTAGCTDAEKVRFSAHQLDGPVASWWENYRPLFL